MAIRVLAQPCPSHVLLRSLGDALSPPLAVVAMGSPMRGDDAAGVHVAQRLTDLSVSRLFSVETSPESFLVPIASCGAASCVLVDAVDARAAPGDIVLLEPQDLEHTDFTTHGLSPKAFLQALAEMSGMTLQVLGIQVGTLKLGDDLSPAVARTVETVADALAALAFDVPHGDPHDAHPIGHGTARDRRAGSDADRA